MRNPGLDEFCAEGRLTSRSLTSRDLACWSYVGLLQDDRRPKHSFTLVLTVDHAHAEIVY